MTDRRARLAATRSPAFMAGYDKYSVMGCAEDVCPWLELSDWLKRQDFLSGWQQADDERFLDREDRQPIHRRPSPMSSLERNRP